MTKIICRKNHDGNTHLTRHNGGWECDGCGAHYTSFIVTVRPGMTPFATESTMPAARKSSSVAKAMGFDGYILPQ